MKKILFACAENKKRSQMAEAIFNHLAKSAVAESAGTMPAQEVDPKAKEVLKEIGIVISDNIAPKKVSDEMLWNADLIISFGCLVAAIFPKEKFEEWRVSDPQTIDEFRTTRDNLVARIKTLIQEKNF
jgi:protein-tyrosine-phosphatase